MIATVPKLTGADIELANFILGLNRAHGTSGPAARALLREIDGLPVPSREPTGCDCPTCRKQRDKDYSHGGWAGNGWSAGYGGYGFNAQDWGRRFLRENAGCAYIDLEHLELCIPEVRSAFDHVAAWHAMLRIARAALVAADAKLPAGQKLIVLVNNSDGQGNSYGSHINFLVTRRLWDNIFMRRVHYALYLAAYQTSSIIFTGQGKVGAENDRPAVDYQLSQRADFFETLTGIQTTSHRPLVNSRDESLCGNWQAPENQDLARLHVIFFDNTLCHGATLLKVGVMQLLLAMLEAERMNPELILDDPLDAVVAWSHDPTLQTRCRLASGQMVTAVELQMQFLEVAHQFVDAGGAEGIVPDARAILDYWTDTVTKLAAGDFTALAGRVDWVLKRLILERAMHQRTGLDWSSPAVRHLDQLYSSLDGGLYWSYEQNGLVERHATEDQIEKFVHQPPEDTRAWTRAMLLRTAPPDTVDHVDWDTVTFKLNGKHRWPTYGTVHLANPLGFTKAQTEAVFRSAETFDDVLDILSNGAGRDLVSRDTVSAGPALVGPIQLNTPKE